MREVIAVIRPGKWIATKRALREIGIAAYTTMRVYGRGSDRSVKPGRVGNDGCLIIDGRRPGNGPRHRQASPHRPLPTSGRRQSSRGGGPPTGTTALREVRSSGCALYATPARFSMLPA